jgi:hypothetical protein
MEIKIGNRIPEGLEWQILNEFRPIADCLNEEGVDQLVQGLYQHARTLVQDEVIWEGYWVDQKDGTTNLYIVGILKHNKLYHTRLMRVKSVPQHQREETEQALTDMMGEYLEGLLRELERTVPPGKGKTGGGWSSNGH